MRSLFDLLSRTPRKPSDRSDGFLAFSSNGTKPLTCFASRAVALAKADQPPTISFLLHNSLIRPWNLPLLLLPSDLRDSSFIIFFPFASLLRPKNRKAAEAFVRPGGFDSQSAIANRLSHPEGIERRLIDRRRRGESLIGLVGGERLPG